jgi:hypothetical protein
MKAIILEYRVEDVRRHGLPRDRYLVLTENQSDEAVEEHRLLGFRLVGRFACDIDSSYVPLPDLPLFERDPG